MGSNKVRDEHQRLADVFVAQVLDPAPVGAGDDAGSGEVARGGDDGDVGDGE